MMPPKQPGMAQALVLGHGFREIHGQLMLVDEHGAGRAFYELTADPDQAQFTPEEAFNQLVHAMQPGQTLRFLKVHWPNAGPRKAFLGQSSQWDSSVLRLHPEIYRGFEDFLVSAPLPFFGRTLMECVVAGEEDLAWIEGAAGLMRGYGIEARKLPAVELQELAFLVFNPRI